jgi:Flp pilus assembly pilin Flp
MHDASRTEAPREPVGRCRGDCGAGLVEYALLLALIVVVCIGAVTYLGGNLDQNYSRSTSSLFSP